MNSSLALLDSQFKQLAKDLELLNNFNIDSKLIGTLTDLCTHATEIPVSCIQETEYIVKELKQTIINDLDFPALSKKQFINMFAKFEKLLESLVITKIIHEI